MAIPFRIAWVNLADAAVVTASSQITTLPVSAVADQDIQKIWRAASTTASLLIDLGVQRQVEILALINSNAIASDAVQFRVSTTDATGNTGDAYDSGEILAGLNPSYRKLVHPINPAVTGRYVKIDLAQSSAPEVGRLVVAAPWEPSRDMRFGWAQIWRDWSRRSRSLGQNVFYDREPRQRGVRFNLFGLTQAEADEELQDLNRLAGTSQDILIVRDITASDLGLVTLWGSLERTVPAAQPHKTVFSAEFEIWDRL